MSSTTPSITPFDHSSASEEDWAKISELRNGILAEATPDDPPTTPESTKNEMLNIPPVFEVSFWAAWQGDNLAAFASIGIAHMETNQHIAQFDLAIRPENRRQGLGASFLPLFLGVAKGTNRSLLLTNTHSTLPAGGRFMEALGANVGLSTRRNDLVMAEVDRELLRTWIDRSQERAAGFEIIEFVGAYPEHELEKISEMQLAINTMPRDTLEIEDFKFTPEHLRQFDEAMVAQGATRWSLIAREKLTGNYVGWTEINFSPAKKRFADVGGTAVSKDYQNLGLGRWLKAAVVDKLLTERPDVDRTRTFNAHSNAPMLKINDQLGFKPALTMNLWQVEIDKVQEYINGREARVPA